MNRVAIVTGASKGIGRCVAEELAREGINVIANYNKSEELAKELRDNLKKENLEIDIVKADVSKRKDIKNLVDFAISKYGRIDILINNAGISEYKMFIDETDDDWNKVINTNLFSAFAMSQEVLKNMIKNKEGCIINISSVWGLVGASMEVLYSVSKAGMDGLTKSLAKEYGPSNIRINSISPGIINTEMNKNLSKEDLIKIKEEIPLEKIGNPKDISNCIKWLINDKYTTGQIISINGGWIIN